MVLIFDFQISKETTIASRKYCQIFVHRISSAETRHMRVLLNSFAIKIIRMLSLDQIKKFKDSINQGDDSVTRSNMGTFNEISEIKILSGV